MILISLAAAMLAAPQNAPPVLDASRPFPSFEGRDAVVVDFWCGYATTGAPKCTASARDGFSLPADAGGWLNTRTRDRADLIDTGLQRRITLRFEPDGSAPTPVDDEDRHWRFGVEELVAPAWEVGLEDLPTALFYAQVTAETRSRMVGAVPLLCSIRADRYLGACIVDRPIAEGADTTMSLRARAIAANLRLAEGQTIGGGPGMPRPYVRVTVDFKGGGDVVDPPMVMPQVVVDAPSDMVLRLYPAAAAEVGRPGSVTMECVAPAARGPLENCIILEENPLNWKFGTSALMIAAARHTSPFTLDGRPYRQIVRQRVSWAP